MVWDVSCSNVFRSTDPKLTSGQGRALKVLFSKKKVSIISKIPPTPWHDDYGHGRLRSQAGSQRDWLEPPEQFFDKCWI